MTDLTPLPTPSYHMTPQYRKNPKSYQIQRLAQRISLLKHQIQKHKHQTQSDHLHLQQMNNMSLSFQQKLTQELNKCHQLKQVQLKTHKNQVQCNHNTKTQIQTFQSNFNLYNQDRLNSNHKFNNQLPTEQPFSTVDSGEAVKKQPKEKEQKITSQRTIKKVVNLGSKNMLPKQKNKQDYLKHTFLTSIILVIFALMVHQILLLL